MKLRTSKLCVNCESIYEGTGPCPDCASEVFFWVFQALGTALGPRGVKMRKEGLEGRKRIPSRILPSLELSNGMFSNLSPSLPEHNRTSPNLFARLGEMMMRVGASVALKQDSREKLFY